MKRRMKKSGNDCSKLEMNFGKYREAILYIFFGGCTTFVNIIVYYICAHLLLLATAPSTVIAWILSVAFAYLTNRIYVFESRSRGLAAILREIGAFVSCRLLTGVMDLAIMYVCVDLLHFNDLIIKIISNVLVIVLNYVASKLLIFRKK